VTFDFYLCPIIEPNCQSQMFYTLEFALGLSINEAVFSGDLDLWKKVIGNRRVWEIPSAYCWVHRLRTCWDFF
jgi:hypothetical protein